MRYIEWGPEWTALGPANTPESQQMQYAYALTPRFQGERSRSRPSGDANDDGINSVTKLREARSEPPSSFQFNSLS